MAPGWKSRSEVVRIVADETGYNVKVVEDVLRATLRVIYLTAMGGARVYLTGFGTFLPRDRAARTGRNPRTGEAIALPAQRSVGFKASRCGK